MLFPQHRLQPVLLLSLLWALAGNLAGNQVIIPFGAIWKYLDDGSEQGSAWSQPGFDDSAWSSGPAELGWGEGDEASLVSFGPVPSVRLITTYFRHTFKVDDPAALPGLRVCLLRDDGAVVYLNGTEVQRSNMPAGPIDSTTFASEGLGGFIEKELVVFDLPASLLVAGENLIAVEVHQDSTRSSDMSFNLEATDGIAPAGPQLDAAALAVSGSSSARVVDALLLRATDCDNDPQDLTFTVSGVQSGRFELVSAPSTSITSFTQAQIDAGQVRFVTMPASFGAGIVAGNLEEPLRHDEISGLISSLINPGVLWAHEDSDNPAILIALGTDGSSRGEWTPLGLTNTDWEDIATASIDGQTLLYIADFGDNGAVRTDLKFYRIKEPLLADANGGTIPAEDIDTIEFQYPATPPGEGGTSARDAESLIVDPHNGDIYVLTKRESVGRLFRLAHQETYTSVQTLEYLGDMPAITSSTIYNRLSSSTGADISRDGLEVLVRNYEHIFYFKRPDLSTSIADLLTGSAVEELPFVGTAFPGGEPVGESIAFDATGDGFFTVGESWLSAGTNPMFYYPRLAPGALPAFSVTVSDGLQSDGPHAADILFNAPPREIWNRQHFSNAELGDPALEGQLWGDLADPNANGRSNLMEYALGTNPRLAQEVDDPIIVTSDTDSLTLVYERDLSKTDIVYQPESSTDLINWIAVSDTLISKDGEIETRSANTPVTAGSRSYLRLRVSVITPG